MITTIRLVAIDNLALIHERIKEINEELKTMSVFDIGRKNELRKELSDLMAKNELLVSQISNGKLGRIV